MSILVRSVMVSSTSRRAGFPCTMAIARPLTVSTYATSSADVCAAAEETNSSRLRQSRARDTFIVASVVNLIRHVDDLHAPVRSGQRIGRVFQLGLPISNRDQTALIDPVLVHQVPLHSIGAAF